MEPFWAATHSQLHVGMPEMLHPFFGNDGFVASDHLDKGMALVDVDDAGLHPAKLNEDLSQFLLVGPEIVSFARSDELSSMLT